MAVCDKNIGYTLSSVTNRRNLEAKLFPNAEHSCGPPGFVLRTRGFAEKFSKRVTSLQSQVHFDLRLHPPVKRRMQTGLSESRTTPEETCFVEGRREMPGRAPARLSQSLKPPGPSGLCELCAGVC